LRDIFECMDANGLLRHSHMLSGYTPSAAALQVVGSIVDRLREINPELIYLLDPVCGDDGKLYVAEEVIPLYKQLLTKATLTTPNQFEAELFVSRKITTLATLRLALSDFHKTYGLPNVLISSCEIPRSDLRDFTFPEAIEGEKFLVCAGSSRTEEAEKSFIILLPRYEEHFEGVGDTFSALTLAHFDQEYAAHPISALAQTAETVLASLGAITDTTRQAALLATRTDSTISLVPSPDETPSARISRLRAMELKLVQSQEAILRPSIKYRAQAL